ncbi:hypothetical protein F2Q70_00014614 [Brassica cretica]|uniref:Uncharacterized protein n=1 Tax=Brassica cretica TaxID=69181 RepID=A0A8S9HQF7_BRACR|nr:hypothetical protein F2Q70_00014614 [Brassica cretica]
MSVIVEYCLIDTAIQWRALSVGLLPSRSIRRYTSSYSYPPSSSPLSSPLCFKASLWSNNRSGEQACTAYVMFKDSYSQETTVLLTVEWFIAHSKEPDFEQYILNFLSTAEAHQYGLLAEHYLRGRTRSQELGLAPFVVSDVQRWAASSVGMFPQVVLILVSVLYSGDRGQVL